MEDIEALSKQANRHPAEWIVAEQRWAEPNEPAIPYFPSACTPRPLRPREVVRCCSHGIFLS